MTLQITLQKIAVTEVIILIIILVIIQIVFLFCLTRNQEFLTSYPHDSLPYQQILLNC